MKGRPTKLDPEIAARIVDLIRAGSYLQVAAAACNVHRATLYRWLEKGEAQKRGVYRDFCVAVERAQAESELRDVMLIRQAGSKDWHAAAWRLERRWPRRYGPQVKMSIREELEDVFAHLEQKLDPLSFERVLEALGDEDRSPEGSS